MKIERRWLALFVFVTGVTLLFPRSALAQVSDLSAQLESLQRWLDDHKPPPTPCTDRCFVISRVKISGAVGKPLAFELEGSVLAHEAVTIQLFGTPSQVRIDHLTENGAPAPLGFDADQYFLVTKSPRFVLRGTLTLSEEDSALTIAGPANSVDIELTTGRVVEGAHLSGVTNQTLHFDPMTPESSVTKVPATFQLSRALRVGREISFQYRLIMGSGSDLGTVRLPLPFGEKVQEVSGSSGWKVEDNELLLPTSGHDAQILVNGTLPSASVFSPDGRSSFEWWLVESDPEHNVDVGGGPKRFEAKDSPITPTTPSARVFLVQRGQHLDVTVHPLVRADVLAAVVRSDIRYVALTPRGDVIADETLTYDNSGLDHLLFTPAGQPMYLATDGRAERILHNDKRSLDILIPLGTGSHSIRVQSLSHVKIGHLFGAIDVPMPSHPLTSSVVEVSLGLPPHVHAVGLAGGDRAQWAVGMVDAIAAFVALLAAALGLRTMRARGLGFFALGGLWLASHALFVIGLTGLLAAFGVWVVTRFVRTRAMLAASSGAVLLVAFVVMRALLAGVLPADAELARAHDDAALVAATAVPYATSTSSDTVVRSAWGTPQGDALDMGGVVGGATPVALSFPKSEVRVDASRELVTRERPFAPKLWYVTDLLLGGLKLLWLVVLGLLVREHRRDLVLLKDRVRERLSRKAEPLPPPAPRYW